MEGEEKREIQSHLSLNERSHYVAGLVIKAFPTNRLKRAAVSFTSYQRWLSPPLYPKFRSLEKIVVVVMDAMQNLFRIT